MMRLVTNCHVLSLVDLLTTLVHVLERATPGYHPCYVSYCTSNVTFELSMIMHDLNDRGR